MVLNKKPVEKNRDILNRKGRKNIVPSVAEAWVQSEDFSAGRPLLPCPASPERLYTADRRWSKVDEARVFFIHPKSDIRTFRYFYPVNAEWDSGYSASPLSE